MSDRLAGGIKAGATSVSLPVELRKAADSTAMTAIIHSGVTASYWRQGGVRVAITPVTLGSVNAAYSSGGFLEVDATNMPGVYRFDVPDAAFATGADWVVISLKVATAFQLNFMFALETVGAAEVYARIGAAGAGLTALGDTRLANLDAEISSRSTYGGGDTSGVTTLLARLASALTITAGKVDVNDKTGFAITSGERTSIATEVEGHLLNEGDSQMLINAIVGAIGNTNVDQAVLIAAIRTDIERAGGAVKLIQAKTDNLPAAPAAVGNIPTILQIAAQITADHGAGSYAGNSGAGALALTVTVTDGTDPLQNATVRLTEGLNSFNVLTDENGVASFSVDPATYELTITKAGYQFTPESIEVISAGNFDKEMAAIAIAPPADPAQSTGHITTRDAVGDAVSGVGIQFQMLTGVGSDSYRDEIFILESNGAGLLQGPFVRGARYQSRRGSGAQWTAFTVPSADTFALPSVLGTP